MKLQNKPRRESDVMDFWKKPARTILEGDIVLLHNWGINDNLLPEIIGVAKLVWDSEYHAWDFKMLAGDYIEDVYDRWRQSPKVIGHYTGYNTFVITDNMYLQASNDWSKFLEQERLNFDKYIKKAKLHDSLIDKNNSELSKL